MIENTFQLATILLIAVACGNGAENSTTNKHGLIAENAMIVSAHPLATQVGVDIMKQVGNAVLVYNYLIILIKIKKQITIGLLALGFFFGGCYPQGPENFEDLDVVITNHYDDNDFSAKGSYAMPDKIVRICS